MKITDKMNAVGADSELTMIKTWCGVVWRGVVWRDVNGFLISFNLLLFGPCPVVRA